MPTPDQKAEIRPISFVYHNLASGLPPVEMRLIIRPEDLSRTETSRLTMHQTLGGSWGDNFGPGIPTVNISGHTGWGSGGRPDGQAAFIALHDLIYKQWHEARARLLASNNDPDMAKLIFRDVLDDFTWVVAPTQFVLNRSKSRPLLSQYKISLVKVSDDISETIKALELSESQRQLTALSSLDALLLEINEFADNLVGEILDFFGPIIDGIKTLVQVTATVLNAVRTVIAAGFRVVDAVTGSLMNIAAGLSYAASNVFATVLAVQSIPGRIMARLTRIRTLFLNAFCILKNTFKSRVTLPNFDDVYGASLCSSTAGGRPLSKYLNTNTFENIMPIIKNHVAVTPDSQSAIVSLVKIDPVLNPPPLTSIGTLSLRAASGVMVGGV